MTVAVDFDGVLHSYQTPWVNAHTIPDPPVSGAIDWLHWLLQDFDVYIFTTRAKTWRGRGAIRAWLRKYSGTLYYEAMGYRGIEEVGVSYKKLPAIVYVDDRAFRFDGVNFPSNRALRAMRPWGRP
jgi:hypothetical protein